MRLSSACFGKQVHPQMDQTSCNAEQIGIAEDLSQMLKIIFYPLPLYYHLFMQKNPHLLKYWWKKELSVCCLFLHAVAQSYISVLCSFPTLEQPKR